VSSRKGGGHRIPDVHEGRINTWDGIYKHPLSFQDVHMFLTHSTISLRLVLVVTTVAGLMGCGPEPDTEAVSPSSAVYFEAVGQGQTAGFADTTELVIRDAQTWARVLGQIETVLPMDDVDFQQSMVLLAAVPTPVGGTNVLFESVEDDGTGWTATYAIGMPAIDCRPIEGLAVPFQAVLVPQSEAAVRFVRTAEPYPCTFR
jgi:hypothetical protein